MSSPMMTRMFGFLAGDGAGDCALAIPGAVKTQTTARINVCSISFIFIGFGSSYFIFHLIGGRRVFQSSFTLRTVRRLALTLIRRWRFRHRRFLFFRMIAGYLVVIVVLTFPVLSALGCFRAPADWARESFNSESVSDL
jgi:hypothetical protein